MHSFKQPLVSFIVTTYNLPSTLLTECLQSILSLSLSKQEREIIIIDDGSAIPSLHDLVMYQDECVYIRQPNQGAAAARNTGLRNANGRYIQFVDGDDCLIPFAYEHCLDVARYNHPDIVCFDASSSKKADKAISLSGPMTGSEYISQNNLQVMVWKYLFRKDILFGLQFTDGLLNEDEEFTPQLVLRAEKMYVSNAKAYYYRQRKGSCTHTKNIKTLMKRLNDTENIIYNFLSKLDALPAMERKAMKRRIAQLTMDYIYNVAKYTHSMKHLEKAIERLSRRGLYPLPPGNYTRKYNLFRKAIQTKAGRRLLLLTTLK